MQPSVFFSSKAYEKVGGLNKRFDHLMDIELWTKICLKGSIFTFDVVLSEMKIHRNQKSNKQINIREMEYISLKHQYGLTEKHSSIWSISALRKRSVTISFNECFIRLIR